MISCKDRIQFFGWASGFCVLLTVTALGCGGSGGGAGGGGGGGGTSCVDPYVGLPSTGAGTLLRGRVVYIPTSGSNVGVNGVRVRFENSVGTLLQEVTTNTCGAYQVDITGTLPSRVNLVNSSIPTSYYRQFLFRGLNYSPTISGCSAALPTINSGILNLFTSIVLERTSSPPPPPPDGCGI